jgi:RNA polymerase sigma-70 factor (ECF subfamily)
VAGDAQPTAGWYAAADDAALLARARSDDEQAFEELVRRYQDRLYTLALRVTSSVQDASETVQEALFAAWRARSSFRGDSAVSTWLYTITRRKALDRIRARDGAVMVEELPEPAPPPGSDEQTRSTQRLDILDALARLSTEHREVAVMADILTLPLADIALITGVPENTVKTRLHRARARLAVLLRGETPVS